jgi:hypothetical protein
MLKEERDPRALGNGAVFDTYKYVSGRAKGYDTWLKAQTFQPGKKAKGAAKTAEKP